MECVVAGEPFSVYGNPVRWSKMRPGDSGEQVLINTAEAPHGVFADSGRYTISMQQGDNDNDVKVTSVVTITGTNSLFLASTAKCSCEYPHRCCTT